jgi:hypothetical protein
MSSYFAEAELLTKDAVGIPQPWVQPITETGEDEERLTAAQGIILGMLISTPIWGLIAFGFYLAF